MSRRLAAIAGLMVWVVCAWGCGARVESSQDFMMEAAQGGLTEVQLGRMAMEKGVSNAVKQFGQQMVEDHTKANGELARLAAQKGTALPKEISSKQKSMVDKLSKLSGADFDKEYMSDMVKDHEEDVEAFQKQAQQGADNDVKGFAAKTLPTLQKHLQMARDAAKEVGAK